MATFLIHIHTGPENPARPTLGCLVAATALKDGHDVTFFMAGDGVHLLATDAIASLDGQGTGALKDHVPAIVEGGGSSCCRV